MRKEVNKIQIGDVLYYVSKTYNRVFEYEVKNIFVEKYVSGYKTIFLCEGYGGTIYSKKEFYRSDVMYMFDTYAEAEKALKEHEHND